MNYDRARQLENKETGEQYGWRWTTMNNGVVRTAGPCIVIDEPFDPASPYKPPKPENVHYELPHTTKEAAERHFYSWSLEQVEAAQMSQPQTCAVCGKWTDMTLGNTYSSMLFRPEYLCDTHRTREELAKLHPLQPDIQIWRS